MADNLRIWDALSKTDPKHTKPFKRSGGFAGTAVRPIWQTLRLTERFGPAGSGWGMDEPQFQTVTAGEEILVFCTVGLWYREGEQMARVYGVGGDKVMGKNKYGPFTNDEAFKASYTDALSNAMKQIGVAADIHMGLFDDEKYVREAKREFETVSVPMGSRPGDFADEARADGLTTETRSTYEIEKEKKAIATVEQSARLAIGLCSDRSSLAAWWNENKGEMFEKLPEESFAKIKEEVVARRDQLPAIAA